MKKNLNFKSMLIFIVVWRNSMKERTNTLKGLAASKTIKEQLCWEEVDQTETKPKPLFPTQQQIKLRQILKSLKGRQIKSIVSSTKANIMDSKPSTCFE